MSHLQDVGIGGSAMSLSTSFGAVLNAIKSHGGGSLIRNFRYERFPLHYSSALLESACHSPYRNVFNSPV
jgi:hypothetical protein